jgi:hypothetical protein
VALAKPSLTFDSSSPPDTPSVFLRDGFVYHPMDHCSGPSRYPPNSVRSVNMGADSEHCNLFVELRIAAAMMCQGHKLQLPQCVTENMNRAHILRYLLLFLLG